jgi:hypothetical protein
MIVGGWRADDLRVWMVTTVGALADERDERRHERSAPAWDDCSGRILDLEIDGFTREGEQAVDYGRRWECDLSRGTEHVAVTSERV